MLADSFQELPHWVEKAVRGGLFAKPGRALPAPLCIC
jgi:hypothetical protein